MKRFLAVMMCAAVIFSASACSVTTNESTGPDLNTEQTEAGKPSGTSKEETSAEAVPEPAAEKVIFTTTDRDGNTVDDSVFAGYELTMINFWEPWCGPCVGEIPDLQKLYGDYSGKGFHIIGVYSETGMEDEVDEIISGNGITYQILHYSSDFDKYQSGYVPTTIFVDKNGNLINTGDMEQMAGTSLIVGAKDYSGWEAVIKPYLEN